MSQYQYSDYNNIVPESIYLTPNLNTQTQKYTSYIQVDSSKRSIQSTNNYAEDLYSLPPYPIQFTNGSTVATISLPNHPFSPNDRIVLDNVTSKNLFLRNILMVKKNSNYVRLLHQNHGMSLHGVYDPSNSDEFVKVNYVDNLPASYSETDDIPDINQEYYILKKDVDLAIQLSNVKGNDHTKSLIGNIPSNSLNRKHQVYLLFTKNDNMYHLDPNSYLIKLDKKSSINYSDGINQIKDESTKPMDNVASNNIYIKFLNLYGVPLKCINCDTSNDSYLTILSTTDDTFTVDINQPAIVDPDNSFYHITDNTDQDFDFGKVVFSSVGGGNQAYVRKIDSTSSGYSDPSQYLYQLDRIYKNVISARLVGSVFPNSQRIINNQVGSINNKLYWRNLDDGDHIYQLSVTPGNYSPEQLARAIEKEFSQTIRFPYLTSNSYDENGLYKYHIVKVYISPTTDIVSFNSYREQLLQDVPNGQRALTVPDIYMEFSTVGDLLNITNIGEYQIAPFDPENESLFIYFTPNSHVQINATYPYAYHNLYRYHNSIPAIDGIPTFLAVLETDRAVLVNFHRSKLIGSVHELNSINTSTILSNFNYNYLTNEVYLPTHHLKVGDIIITDQFFDPNSPNQIFVYEITNIKNSDYFAVQQYKHGEKYKFIYDSIIINFNTPSNANTIDWLDPTLSFLSITPLINGKNILNVYHPNHNLETGDTVILANSKSINGVPASTINQTHIISLVVDLNHYQILLNAYTPQAQTEPTINLVSVKYPGLFQLLFNQADTLGNILSFHNVGEESSITPYGQTIRNTDPYYADSTNPPLKKLNMTGYNYFYLCCDELSTINNTKPVPNVFAVIRWFDNPGSVVFDSFVPTVKMFNTPLASLSILHFSMYNPDGKLVDFNGIDHSFTIEIVELFGQPTGTDMNARMNSEILVRKV